MIFASLTKCKKKSFMEDKYVTIIMILIFVIKVVILFLILSGGKNFFVF